MNGGFRCCKIPLNCLSRFHSGTTLFDIHFVKKMERIRDVQEEMSLAESAKIMSMSWTMDIWK